MTHKIIGVDVDGVLADFNHGLRQKLEEVTGRNLHHDRAPLCWNYATEQYGYTKEEDKATWDAIIADPYFWRNLRPEPGAIELLNALYSADSLGAEVYFITNRPGVTARWQTIRWLTAYGFWEPTVLIARGDKGPIANGLGLTHFIDDRPENCFSVAADSPSTFIWMPARPYNSSQADRAFYQGIMRNETHALFIEAISCQ